MSTRPRLTFQDMVKRRQQETFIGRSEHMTSFRANLDLPIDSDQRQFIFAVSGQGGVGKSSLLQRYRRTLIERLPNGTVHAWVDERHESILSVMEHIAREFEGQRCSLKAFTNRYRLYQDKRAELERDPNAPSGFANFVGQAAKISLRLGGATPAGLVLKLIDEDAAAETVKDFVEYMEYIGRKAANQDEAKLVQSPVEVLTPVFVSDLCAVGESRLVAIFFDTFEQTGEYLDEWLRGMLRGQYGEMPLNILLAIAGRHELARNKWDQLEDSMLRISLEPFTDGEAIEYLARKGITDQRVAQVIMQLSGRLPLLVATLAAESPADPSQVGDPTGTAVERFLQWTGEAKHRQLAIDAALPRHLNEDIIAVLSEPTAARSLFEWLKGMPFVKESPGVGWDYHEVVRTQMLRYKYLQSPQAWTQLHERLAQHFSSQVPSNAHDVAAIPRDERHFQAKLAWLYHHLCHDPLGGLADAANGFVFALSRNRGFALRWAETTRQAGADSNTCRLRELGDILSKSAVGYRDQEYTNAAQGLSSLLKLRLHAKPASAVARQLRGRCYMFGGKNRQALIDFDAALSNATVAGPLLSSVYADRGSLYLRMDNGKSALADFQRAAHLSPRNPTYASRCAQALWLMERHDDAVEQINIAIDLAPDRPEYLIQRARLRTDLEQVELAISDLDRALDIEPANVKALVARGLILLELQRFEDALGDFSDAIAIEPLNAHLMNNRALAYLQMGRIDESIEELTQAISIDATSPSLRLNRAALFRTQGRWHEALHDYEMVLELQPDNQDVHRYIAMACVNIGQYERALKEVDLSHSGTTTMPLQALVRGLALEGIGRLEEAEQAFMKAASSEKIDSRVLQAIEAQARVQVVLGRYSDALDTVHKGLSIESENVYFLAERANILRLMGKYQEALDAYDQTFEKHESLGSAWATNYGLTLTYLHRYTEAIEWYEQILAADPDDYAALYNIAVAVVYAGLESAQSYVNAARAALTAVLNSDSRGAALYGLGGLAALAGSHTLALDLLRQAIPLEPSARPWARHDMAWESLRQDGTFRALVF